MANRSYLAATNECTIYPSAAESDFDSKVQTIAQAAYCVPLLWLGMFRPSDMRTQEFSIDGKTVTATAPVVEVKTAVLQLRQSSTVFSQMFPSSNFVDYCDLLCQGIESTGRKYVTIEMEEIACLGDPDDFYDDCRFAIRALNGDEPLAEGRARMIAISGISYQVNVPSAKCMLDDLNVTDGDMDSHSRIIGSSWFRPVPWEGDLENKGMRSDSQMDEMDKNCGVFYSCHSTGAFADEPHQTDRDSALSIALQVLRDETDFFGIVDVKGGVLQMIVENNGRIWMEVPDPEKQGSHGKHILMSEIESVISGAELPFDPGKMPNMEFYAW